MQSKTLKKESYEKLEKSFQKSLVLSDSPFFNQNKNEMGTAKQIEDKNEADERIYLIS